MSYLPNDLYDYLSDNDEYALVLELCQLVTKKGNVKFKLTSRKDDVRGRYILYDDGSSVIEIARHLKYSEQDGNEPTAYFIVHEVIHFLQSIIKRGAPAPLDFLLYDESSGFSPELRSFMQARGLSDIEIEESFIYGVKQASYFPKYVEKGTLDIEIPAFALMSRPDIILDLARCLVGCKGEKDQWVIEDILYNYKASMLVEEEDSSSRNDSFASFLEDEDF